MVDLHWASNKPKSAFALSIAPVLLAIGCGSTSDTKPDCGTAAAPMTFTLKGVSPAVGSSVPNSNIVQSFTIAGQLVQLTPTFVLAPPLHTAGAPAPSPIGWTITVSGEDTVYTSQPISWATAPGHVELEPNAPVQVQSTGCVWTLPMPTFSYDVTSP